MPFLHSVENVFKTMVRTQVEFGKPEILQKSTASHDVSGIIGFTGDALGSIVLSFPKDVAKALVGRFVGTELATEDPDFADAIGELVNMVAGGAKAKFDTARCDISCPSVVIGAEHVVFQRKNQPLIAIPVRTDVGDFVVEVSLRLANASADAPVSAAHA
jgi:chemotaxis protein CheX